jgi:AraC family transcriptional regulator
MDRKWEAMLTESSFKDGASAPFAERASRPLIDTKLDGLRSETGNAATSDKTAAAQRQSRALQKWRLKRVVEYVEDHFSEKIALSDLAAVAGLSRMHFASQFRMATGLRPHEFLLRRRIQRAEGLLRNTTMPIDEIALTVGFQTQAYFTTVFKRFAECTPGRWRAVNAGAAHVYPTCVMDAFTEYPGPTHGKTRSPSTC